MPDFDGVFCCTDRLACQVLKTLEALGVRVPQDVQIVCFDGARRFGHGGWFCATIVQPVAQIAEQSVDLLLREDRTALPSLICLPVRYAPGGAIGPHQHKTGDDLNYILSGTGTAFCDGVPEVLSPGVCHICKKGSEHQIVNTGSEDLTMLTVVAER